MAWGPGRKRFGTLIKKMEIGILDFATTSSAGISFLSWEDIYYIPSFAINFSNDCRENVYQINTLQFSVSFVSLKLFNFLPLVKIYRYKSSFFSFPHILPTHLIFSTFVSFQKRDMARVFDPRDIAKLYQRTAASVAALNFSYQLHLNISSTEKREDFRRHKIAS